MRAFGNQFGGSARGGGAKIGDEITDGEIDFVADSGDNRQRRFKDGTRDDLFVESPQILKASSTPGDEDKIKAAGGFQTRGPVIQQAESAGDFLGGPGALNAATRERNFQRRLTALDDVQDVANGGAGFGGHQPDSLGVTRERPFAFRRKKPFGLESLLQLFEGQLQGANALQFDRANDELVLATRLINRHVAVQEEFVSIFQEFAMGDRFAAEKHTLQLRVSILQREVDVP
jgi:hypothetical protein